MTAPDLADLTWEEAREAFASGAPALLPIGATEAHGPHLPLATDVYLSLELAARVRAALGEPAAILLPPVAFAVTEYAAGFSGTLSLSPDTARALLCEILTSLGRHGAGRVALVNSHLEPAHTALLAEVAAACRERPRAIFVDHCRKPWALELSAEFKTGDCHAGAYETSLLLASRWADRVRIARMAALEPRWLGLVGQMKAGARRFEEMGAREAYFGDPRSASAEEGERLWEVLVRMWVEAIRAARAPGLTPPGTTAAG